MKIAITGHRPNKLGSDYALTSTLIKSIRSIIVNILISKDVLTDSKLEYDGRNNVTLITGMALGIDTLFAQIAIDYNIPFVAALPFKGQDRMWPTQSRVTYNNILKKANSIVVCDMLPQILDNTYNIEQIAHTYSTYLQLSDTPFTAHKMQLRNQWMVDQLTEPEDILIAVWDGSTGGTANCVNYAIDKFSSIPNKIYFINPQLIESGYYNNYKW